MNRQKVDKKTSIIGLLSGFDKTDAGLSLTMLHDGKSNTYPCTQDVYDYIYNGRVGIYPNVLELVYILIFNPYGVVVQLLQADGYENEDNCLVTSFYSIATAMRTKPATVKTPRCGDFFKIENNTLCFSADYDKNIDEICYYVQEGPFDKAGSNVMHQMAENFDIYTWNWPTKGSPEITDVTELDKLENYVPGFELGTLDDVYNCRWIWIGSIRGNDNKWDTICAFRHNESN